MQSEDAAVNSPHLRVAPDAAIPNFAEFSIEGPTCAGPYRALIVFNQSKDMQSSQLRVLRELAVLPTYEPTPRTDPKSPVTRHDQFCDGVGREVLIWLWLPKYVADAIEAIQAKGCSQPEVTVGCLRDCDNGAFGKSVPDLPDRMRVLADVQRRIQSERTRSRY
jgi:hypothetical protein